MTSLVPIGYLDRIRDRACKQRVIVTPAITAQHTYNTHPTHTQHTLNTHLTHQLQSVLTLYFSMVRMNANPSITQQMFLSHIMNSVSLAFPLHYKRPSRSFAYHLSISSPFLCLTPSSYPPRLRLSVFTSLSAANAFSKPVPITGVV